MRLGGPIFDEYASPDEWIAALKRYGYTAAYCPVGFDTTDDVVKLYVDAAAKAGIVIAEVGAWSNPLSPDENERNVALEKCRNALSLADRIGACCAVNISGSRGTPWHGPDPRNFTDETFDMIVECVRGLIDTVRPTRAFFCLETMQNMYPHTADSYLRLVQAIDRKQFAVHFDPVNIIYSPERYYSTGAIIREFVDKLGPHIKSCHAKDVTMAKPAIAHLDEIPPGLGNLDYATYLKQLDRLAPDLPLMLEHLKTAEEYEQAANYVRHVADQEGVKLR